MSAEICRSGVSLVMFVGIGINLVFLSAAQDFQVYLRRRSRRRYVIADFDPLAAEARASGKAVSWINLYGAPSTPPDFSALPSPSDVLAGRAAPDFDGIRLRSKDAFVCGHLHNFAHVWDKDMSGLPEYDIVRSWIHGGVDKPSFFQHYRGPFGKSRFFDSASPPRMFFQNAPICEEYVSFITDTITLRLEEGSMRCVGKVGIDEPPHVVNALSIEPIKPRLILSMRAVNLFCRDTPFSLTTLSNIVRRVPADGFFSSYDDVQGYKQMCLTPASQPYCGFEWGGYWFVDTTLPFGWKNSAYVYSMTGSVLSSWLERRGVHTALWIDDRFVGDAPYI